jgi:hypothetical protein
VATIELHCTNRVAAARKSYSKQTEQEQMAARVSEMPEDGDVRGAVQLAASDEKIAPYSNNTVDALISNNNNIISYLFNAAKTIYQSYWAMGGKEIFKVQRSDMNDETNEFLSDVGRR